ncbi:MAG: SulP family inorganic anion transporter, partial [Pseudomonadota bacterium]
MANSPAPRKSWLSDTVLGVFDGVDSALWGYGFASILFAGALSPFLPLAVTLLLLGWGLIGLFVALTSASRVHIANVDEQGVVILASAASLLAAHLGPDIDGPRGLSTMLALMALTSLTVAVAFVLVGHLKLARLLELLPFPVICGFMAGVGWLLLDAAVFVTVDEPISAQLPTHLAEGQQTLKLLATLGCGVLMIVFMAKVRRAWAFPAVALLIIGGF